MDFALRVMKGIAPFNEDIQAPLPYVIETYQQLVLSANHPQENYTIGWVGGTGGCAPGLAAIAA